MATGTTHSPEWQPGLRLKAIAKNITVILDPSSCSEAAADPLIVGILGRYQQLLRNKVSWSGAAGAPSQQAAAPVLPIVSAKITGTGDAITSLGPDTDESVPQWPQ